MVVDGDAAVEALRAKLGLAKEQARRSDAAALKAAEVLKANRLLVAKAKIKLPRWLLS